MNKTVKTIAWICLVLGLLGVAVDVGVYDFGRSLVTQLQGSIEAGEIPALIGKFTNMDEDDWGKRSFNQGGWFRDGGMMDSRRDFDTFFNHQRLFSGMHDGSFRSIGFAFPFLLLMSGPVLTVVGTVMLIVNREPKDSDSKEKKEKSKKK